MPRYRHNPETGQRYMFDNGRWRELSPMETEIAAAGAQGKALSFLMGLSPLTPIADPEAAAAAEAINPIATYAPAAGAITSLAGRGLGRMSSRLLARSGPQTTKGTSALHTPSGFVKRPQDFVPEPIQGVVRGAESAIEAAPGLRVLTDMARMQRQRVAGQKLGRWLGVEEDVLTESGGKLTDDVMETALQRTDDMYASLERDLTQKITDDQIKRMAQKAIDRELLIPEIVDDLKNSGWSKGRQVIELRSELRALKRGAQNNLERQKIDQTISEIQKVIDRALKGTDAEPIAREADKRYARWMQMKGSSAIRDDGTVNRASLRQMLKKQDARAVLGQRRGIDQESDELLDAMSEWGKLGKEMPSSGTAERAAAYSALTGLGGFIGGAAIL